ncbi:hypothetical protein DAPPUDRAFT_265439 [Daphnia pulex]|uniref:Uncharacterized protein n=1 Tax=Daphnia pulex TaxID=6669 RepID=E9HTF8_DAPPU|nr:hypothetical protein DAPPUDRAFT_265439 [Daphnia pulex]|eukprot:EFX64974.1 hypothetical protein DAPPUDRAFT_265439 [Daphnia pulex]
MLWKDGKKNPKWKRVLRSQHLSMTYHLYIYAFVPVLDYQITKQEASATLELARLVKAIPGNAASQKQPGKAVKPPVNLKIRPNSEMLENNHLQNHWNLQLPVNLMRPYPRMLPACESSESEIYP